MKENSLKNLFLKHSASLLIGVLGDLAVDVLKVIVEMFLS